MKSLSDCNQAIRRVIWQIVTYLQETFVYEFPWLVPGSIKALEILETRQKYPNLTTKQIFSELLTFVLVTAFFTLVIFLLKYSKDEEEEEEYEDAEQASVYPLPSENAAGVESSASSVYSVALEPGQFGYDYARRDCGDSVFIPRINEIPSVDPNDDDSFVNLSDYLAVDQNQAESLLTSDTSMSSFYPLQRGAHRKFGRAARLQYQHVHGQNGEECECMVRRTRSGQIYGRYPG